MTYGKWFYVSWSKIREWMTCPWRFNLSYEQKYETKKVAEPLWYGGLFHDVLDYIYTERIGGKPLSECKRISPKSIKAKLKRLGAKEETLDDMYEYSLRYIDHIQRHENQEMDTVLLTEFPFQINITKEKLLANTSLPIVDDYGMGISLPWKGAIFLGVMDLVGVRRSFGEIWDHKLQSNHPSTNDLDHPSISYPQMGIYAWASSELGSPIHRSTLNVYGRRRKENNVQRYPLMITDAEMLSWRNWLYDKIIEMMTIKARVKRLGLFDCGRCHFRYPCSKHITQGEEGLQRALAADYQKKVYDHRANTKWQKQFPDHVIEQLGGE